MATWKYKLALKELGEHTTLPFAAFSTVQRKLPVCVIFSRVTQFWEFTAFPCVYVERLIQQTKLSVRFIEMYIKLVFVVVVPLGKMLHFLLPTSSI